MRVRVRVLQHQGTTKPAKNRTIVRGVRLKRRQHTDGATAASAVVPAADTAGPPDASMSTDADAAAVTTPGGGVAEDTEPAQSGGASSSSGSGAPSADQMDSQAGAASAGTTEAAGAADVSEEAAARPAKRARVESDGESDESDTDDDGEIVCPITVSWYRMHRGVLAVGIATHAGYALADGRLPCPGADTEHRSQARFVCGWRVHWH